MKPFNLEAAKAGAAVCTRDGRKVRIICCDLKDDAFPIVAAIASADGSYEAATTHTREGRFYEVEECSVDARDLFMASVQRDVWVNLYKVSGDVLIVGGTYSSQIEAIRCMEGDRDYIGTFPITYEE